MEILTAIIQLLGGLAMFLYGIEVMGDGLKNSSGAALKRVLEKVTGNVVMGVLTGALLKPAFAQVLPALFGALGAGYFIKHWRISFFPIIIMIIVLVFAPTMGASTLLFVGIVASVGGALFMYKKGMLDRVK